MYPDYTISGGYFNQGGLPPMWQFRVDFKVPAYFWRKQRLGIEEQEASLGEARRSYESSVRTVEAAIQEEYFAATTARRLVDLYRQAVVPEAKLALESSLASYEAGAVDFLAVFTNFMTVVDYELMNHEEIMRFHVAMARLEELSGMEVEP
jgi:outer membrane protein TolC